MIVRRIEEGFLLIKQHDHGKVSGQFADHWLLGGRPGKSLRTAAWWHDVGWEELDQRVKMDPEAEEPYSFIDYPLSEKLTAYRHGLDHVQQLDPLAGCLCSLHYATFFQGTSEPEALRFLQEEEDRQARLKQKMSQEERSLLPEGLAFLRLCDDLSLFLCLNPPGHNQHPWYKEGIHYNDWTLVPHWNNHSELQFAPGIIDDPFPIAIPYQLVNGQGQHIGKGTYEIDVMTKGRNG
ncbi:DUF3891 family protein [Marininema halotolerans]|uniref:HD domain-containing protein n=1 Tax=Marininema halotolerans TaxID=1155944 RepID=A0A1I6RJ75_9BACL|nr:DUF3891 family protein [Marininema halotolerans]SFS64725.1 Protein of unknown function [Marininema halotolerans]